jgi:hypothetical protein
MLKTTPSIPVHQKLLALLAVLTNFGISFVGFSALAEVRVNAVARHSGSQSTFPTPREVLQEGLNPHIDVTAGLNNPEGRFKTGPEFGFAFGFQPYIPFGLGMSLTYSSNSATDGSTRRLERTAVLLKGSYHFAGSLPIIKYSHVGVAIGPVINEDATYFGLAPIMGFDIPVQEWVGEYISFISVGMEAKYMMVTSREADGLSINGALKYWF